MHPTDEILENRELLPLLPLIYREKHQWKPACR